MGYLKLGQDQCLAIKKATEWFREGHYLNTPCFIIGGYAGTGKSTVLSQILISIGIPLYKVAFATYTGKAALILRRQGLNAYTLHRLLYNTSVSSTGLPRFKRKSHITRNIELICIDEFSMVPEKIFNDLLSFHIPIIALGDPGQLPPIYGENQYIKNPDIFLTEIYRQKENSSLLTCATDIRNGIDIYTQKYDTDVTIVRDTQLHTLDLTSYDIIVCATNATRIMFNKRCRALYHMEGIYPNTNDKIICVLNNFKTAFSYDGLEFYLVNGLIGISTSFAYTIDTNVYMLNFKPDGIDIKLPVYVKPDLFEHTYDNATYDEKALFNNIMYGSMIVLNVFDYGYAITAHKAQGSEWDNVLIYDDCFFNDTKKYIQWLYTSVTRSKARVTIVRTT
jgi:exodeoxyribonuclease-5